MSHQSLLTARPGTVSPAPSPRARWADVAKGGHPVPLTSALLGLTLALHRGLPTPRAGWLFDLPAPGRRRRRRPGRWWRPASAVPQGWRG